MNPQQTHGSPQTSGPNFDGLEVSKKNIANHALEVQANLNTMCAIEYLKSNDVDSDEIWRILNPSVNAKAKNHRG